MNPALPTRLDSIPSAEPKEARGALRMFAGGVTIVTTRSDESVYGITVTSFASVSLDPPIILASINNESQISDGIVDARFFAVTVLDRSQEALARQFAASIPAHEKFAGVAIRSELTGAPLIDGGLAWFDCALDRTLVVATHTIMFGRVLRAGARDGGGEPLVYHDRGYRHLA